MQVESYVVGSILLYRILGFSYFSFLNWQPLTFFLEMTNFSHQKCWIFSALYASLLLSSRVRIQITFRHRLPQGFHRPSLIRTVSINFMFQFFRCHEDLLWIRTKTDALSPECVPCRLLQMQIVPQEIGHIALLLQATGGPQTKLTDVEIQARSLVISLFWDLKLLSTRGRSSKIASCQF